MTAAFRSTCVCIKSSNEYNSFDKLGREDSDVSIEPSLRQSFALEQQDFEMAVSDQPINGTTLSTTPSNSIYTTTTTTEPTTNSSFNLSLHFKNAQDIASIQGQMNPGYASDDEASDSDSDHEPQDSGRTRSSTRRANQKLNEGGDSGRQAQQANKDSDKAASDGRGRKRKKTAQDGSGDDDSDNGNEKSRSRLDAVQVEKPIEPTCSCPKNVMKCIGILPSLPIVGQFYDSEDDSESSFDDDLRHTVLPSVTRSRPGEGGG